MRISSISSLAGMGLAGFARLGLFIWISRSLGEESLALVSATLAVAVVLGLVWPTSAGIAYGMFSKSSNLTKLQSSSFVGWAHKTVIIFASVTFIFCFIYQMISGESLLLSVLIGLVISSYGIYTYLRAVLISDGSFSRNVVAEGLAVVAGLIIVLSFIQTLDINVFMFAFLGMFVTFSITSGDLRKLVSFERPNVERRLVKSTINVSFSQVLTNSALQFVLLVVVFMGTANEAGFMSQAFSITTPASLFGVALAQSAVPHLARQKNSKAMHQELMKILRWFIPALTLIFIFLSLVGNQVLAWLYSPTWTTNSTIPLMAVGLWFFTLALLLGAARNAAHRPDQLIWAYGIGIIAGVIAFILMYVVIDIGVIYSSPIAFLILCVVTVAFLVVALLRDRST